MIDPKPRDTDPIHLILLPKSLVNSGAKTPECFGYKSPLHWRNTPHTRGRSHQPETPSHFWGGFRYTKLDGTTILLHVVIHVRPQKLFALNGYFSTLNMALFCSKMQIITATVLQGGPNHILDLYYVDIQSIYPMSHIRCRPPLPMVGICQNSAEIAARPKELVSNFTSSQKQVNKTCSWRPP